MNNIISFVQNKGQIAESLHKNDLSNWGVFSLIIIIIAISWYRYHQRLLSRIYRRRFEKVLLRENIFNHNLLKVTEDNKIHETHLKTKGNTVSQDLKQKILGQLEIFENSNQFLEQNITLQTIATSFKTNSKYLSLIINEHKHKSFIQYVNDLRIAYAITDLQKNKKIRKYTLQALAIEYGFNNAESFSTAFKKTTGIKPSFFIKELDAL